MHYALSQDQIVLGSNRRCCCRLHLHPHFAHSFTTRAQQALQRMATLRLSPSRVKGLGRILKPEAQKFSPCNGLITISSPNLIANLRSSPLHLPAAELAREVFHQRSGSSNDGVSLSSRRYGPIGVTKSRSRAAYWITPSMMGAMTGLAASDHANNHDWLTDARIDEILFSQGIECNYVHREWSGVSMVRYRKIVRHLAEELHSAAHILPTIPTVRYGLPVTLAYVWEKAKSKQCLLDYILSLESTLQQPVLLPEYADLRQFDSLLRLQWLTSQFTWDETTTHTAHTAAQCLLHNSTTPQPPINTNTPSTGTVYSTTNATTPMSIPSSTPTSTTTRSTGEALEIVAASYAMERSFKVPIRLGRYAYGDGRPRPDCVEVVVREIFDTLIYDAESDRLCPELLPATTVPAVRDFYAALLSGEIDDVSTQAGNNKNTATGSRTAESASKKDKTSKTGVRKATSVHPAAATVTINNSVGELANTPLTTATDIGGAGKSTTTTLAAVTVTPAAGKKQYWEATTAGRAWFQLCSELPHSLYLSTTSDNRQYELKPTMLNVCDTIRTLLGAERADAPKDAQVPHPPSIAPASVTTAGTTSGKATIEAIIITAADASTVSSTHSSLPWKLKDLEQYWNEHCTKRNHPHRKIVTSEGILRFRAPFSDTETINREIGTIQYVTGKAAAIDIELESSHQLATVKHKLCVDPAQRLWGAQNRDVFARYWQNVVTNGENVTTDGTDEVCGAAVSAVLHDNMLSTLLTSLQQRQHSRTAPDHYDTLITQALLSARWGEERRHLTDSADPHTTTLSVTDASLTSADAQRQLQQSIHMTVSALKLIAHKRDATHIVPLVKWMLQEAPTEMGIETLAAALLQLPPHVRVDSKFHTMLATTYEAQQAALMQQMVLIGTEQCPSKSLFTKCGLPLSKRLILIKFCMKYKLCVLN